MSGNSEPVWKRPGWITAMVGLVSVLFTVPEIIGDYLTKQQDIELAKEQTRTVELQNKESKQDQEFKIINNTLAQLDTERVFLLRYLAATLDDPEARDWAKAEVERLDNLATRKEELAEARNDIEKKELELQARIKEGLDNNAELEDELARLKAALDKKDSEVAELRQKAGLSSSVSTENFVRNLKFDYELESKIKKVDVWLFTQNGFLEVFTCFFDGDDCRYTIRSSNEPITLISIDPGVTVKTAVVNTLKPAGGFKLVPVRSQEFVCEKNDSEQTDCFLR